MRCSHTKTKAQKIQGSVVNVVKALSEAHVIVGAATKKAIARGAHQISFSLTRKKRPKNSITTDKQKLEKKQQQNGAKRAVYLCTPLKCGARLAAVVSRLMQHYVVHKYVCMYVLVTECATACKPAS